MNRPGVDVSFSNDHSSTFRRGRLCENSRGHIVFLRKFFEHGLHQELRDSAFIEALPSDGRIGTKKCSPFITNFRLILVRPRAGPHTSGELMFDHVKFGVSDYAASKAFFLKALEPLGVAIVQEGPPTYGVELSPKGKASLCLYQTEEKPAHLHLAFRAENRQQVEASIARLWRRVAKTMVRLVCARTTTRDTMQLSSLVRTGTTSKWFATNPRPNPSGRLSPGQQRTTSVDKSATEMRF